MVLREQKNRAKFKDYVTICYTLRKNRIDIIRQDLKGIGMTGEARQLSSTEKIGVEVWPSVSPTRIEPKQNKKSSI